VYDSTADAYCYAGTTVLRNKANLRTQGLLDVFEHAAVLNRADEALPAGRMSVSHYRAVHRHLFQDVYPWAGRFRTVRIAKGGSMFCYPEHIPAEMNRLFSTLKAARHFRDLTHAAFAAEAGNFLAELNAIHPFREGNGRTQLTFFALLAEYAGHPLDFDRLDPGLFLSAMIRSFGGEEADLVGTISHLLR
jgi:cell filamentation protein